MRCKLFPHKHPSSVLCGLNRRSSGNFHRATVKPIGDPKILSSHKVETMRLHNGSKELEYLSTLRQYNACNAFDTELVYNLVGEHPSKGGRGRLFIPGG